MRILALAGKRHSGKSSSSEIVAQIADSMGIKIKRRSFGFTLKQMYAKAYGVDPKDLDDPFEKEKYRKHLIQYADWVKSTHPMYFIDSLWGSIFETDNVVIDDMRTIEELQSVMLRGGKPYKIEVDNFIRQNERGASYNHEIDTSLGETELPDLSSDTFRALGGGVIYNNKTKDDLRTELTFVTRLIFLPKPEVLIV